MSDQQPHSEPQPQPSSEDLLVQPQSFVPQTQPMPPGQVAPTVVNVVQAPSAAPMSGLAVAALVMGILAVVFAFIPIVNVLAFLLGGLAVIFGIIAVATADGTKKRGRGLGITGLILGVIGFIVAILVIVVFTAAVSSVSTAIDEASNNSALGSTKGTPADPLPFGTSVTLDNGLTVEVGQPAEFTPSDTAGTDLGQTYFWSVPVSVTNGGVDTAALLGTANGFLASGETCSDLFDSAQFGDQLFALDGSLPPGKTKTSTLAFQCPATGSPELELMPDLLAGRLYYSSTAK